VDQARAQYLQKLAAASQVAQSSDESEIKAANEQLQRAKGTLQMAQRTSRLRKSAPKLPSRHPEWNSEPT
jgi:hypothetical protein